MLGWSRARYLGCDTNIEQEKGKEIGQLKLNISVYVSVSIGRLLQVIITNEKVSLLAIKLFKSSQLSLISYFKFFDSFI